MAEEFIAPDASATSRRQVDDAPWHAAYGLAAEVRASEASEQLQHTVEAA